MVGEQKSAISANGTQATIRKCGCGIYTVDIDFDLAERSAGERVQSNESPSRARTAPKTQSADH